MEHLASLKASDIGMAFIKNIARWNLQAQPPTQHAQKAGKDNDFVPVAFLLINALDVGKDIAKKY